MGHVAVPARRVEPDPEIAAPLELHRAHPVPLHGEVLQVVERRERRDYDLAWRAAPWILLAGLCFIYRDLLIYGLIAVVFLAFVMRRGIGWILVLLVWPRGRGGDLLTAFYITVRSYDDGREHQARIKGRRIEGIAAPGHEVRLWGLWRRGILIVFRGENLTTRSRIGGFL